MEVEEQNQNLAHEFDPELALASSEAKAEAEAELNEEIEIQDEEIYISNEDNEEKEEGEGEGEGKAILRARKKKRKYVNYNANDYKNTNTNTTTTKKTTTTKTNNNTNITLNKKKVILKKDLMYDPDFNVETNYFYQKLSDSDWDKIKSFLKRAFSGQIPTETQLKNFFDNYPKLKKGNIEKLQDTLDSVASEKKNFNTYQTIMKFFLKEFYKPKPTICNVYFFPNAKNEKYLIEMLRTCKKSLNVAIFSITRDNFAKAIIEVFKKGIDVKIIADDECVKNYGSDVYKLAAAGIPCKTDSNAQFHMHNKYAIIDESVIITGSFNWTTQAINNNQENLFFYEDKQIAEQYSKEFNNLWNTFTSVIDKEMALRQIELEKKNKKTNTNSKK